MSASASALALVPGAAMLQAIRNVVAKKTGGTGPLLASLGAVVWLGEAMSVVAMTGVAAVAAGVFSIAGDTLIDGCAVKVTRLSPILVDPTGVAALALA